MYSKSPEGAGAEILHLVEDQVALGPRVPGSEAHERLAGMLADRLRAFTPEVVFQSFVVPFRGRSLSCANVIGVFRAKAARRAEMSTRGRPQRGRGPVLLGTHFDTRPRADREKDEKRRETPIGGANDGGSGTAVLLHMLGWLDRSDLSRDVIVAFFDAEDLGGIDGKEYSLGAEFLAANPLPGLQPSEALVLDMVGGAGMVFDVDAHILGHPPSRELTGEIFRVGASRGFSPFAADKPGRFKYIVSDHRPFALRGIASCILIDIDYPQWHTLDDLPSALSAESLEITEEVLLLFLSRFRG